MKYLFGIIIVVVCVGVYSFAKKNNPKEQEEKERLGEDIVDNAEAVEPYEEIAASVGNENLQGVIHNMKNTKKSAQETIVARHKEATRIMEESLGTILDESVERNYVSANEEDIKSLDEALTKMLDD